MNEAYPVAALLADLLNRARGNLPPLFEYDFLRVAGVLAVGGDLWAAHYATPPLADFTPDARIVRETTPDGDRVAAGGLLLPTGKRRREGHPALLAWMLADENAGTELGALLGQLEGSARAADAVHLTTTRDGFGAGWPGFPSSPVVDETLRAHGWQIVRTWQVFAAEGVRGDKPDVPPGVRVDVQPDGDLITHYLAVGDDEGTIAQCDVWALPDAISSVDLLLPQDWMTVEYVGTEPNCRRRGLARMLIKAAMWAGARGGIRNWLMWTEPENVPAMALAWSIGFTPAFMTHEWEKRL